MAAQDKSKHKLPKRIAGVKLPPRVRKSAFLLWLSESEFVRELVVSAVIAGFAAAWNDRRVQRQLARLRDSGSSLAGATH